MIKREIRKLIRCIGWDLQLALKYQIVTVAVIITVLYIFIFKLIPGADITEVLVTFIFSDPTMLGFIFIGAMVLFEKDANTLQALVVTPIKPWQYLWSKAISLTIIALPCSLGMAITGHGLSINYFFFSIAVVLSSLLFTFIGFIGVSRVKTFYEYIIVIPIIIAPSVLPLADYYGLFTSPLLYIIPTQGSLILFHSAFAQVESWEIIYSIFILIASTIISYYLARRSFVKQLIGKTI